MKHILILLLAFVVMAANAVYADESVDFEDKDKVSSEEPAELRKQYLPLQRILAHTYLYNPTLRAARAELNAIQEQLPQAQAGWKPSASLDGSIQSLDIEGSNFPGAPTGTTSRDIALNLNQPLYRGGRTVAGTEAANFVIKASVANINAMEQSIMLDTIIAYADMGRDMALLELAKNNADLLSEDLKAAQVRFKYGELTKTDVAQAEARVSRANADIISATSDLRITRSRLAELTGIPADDLAYDMSTMAHQVPASLDEAQNLALTFNPLIEQAVTSYEAADKDVDSVFGELLPELGAFAGWNRTYDPQPGLIDEQTTKSIGVTATIPLYQAGATRSRIRQAKHTHNQRYLQIAETRRAVEQNVINAWEILTRARGNIKARESQIKAAELASIGVKKESDVGARTVLDVLDAKQELLDARTALVTARRDENVAKYGLLQSMGFLTPKTLGFQGSEIDYSQYLKEIQGYILKTYVDRLDK